MNDTAESFEEGVEPEETQGEEEIKEPYDVSLINVSAQPMTVFQVIRKIDKGNLDLHPVFQRELVWDKRRKSRLIESLLIRIPLPSFYFDALDDHNWTVVDGLQRLNTLVEFLHDQFTLSDLEFVEEADGSRFSELSEKFQRRIEDTTLSLYVIMPDTPAEAKFTIFRRINTGGMVLNAQEIRNCIYAGAATEFLRKLAESEEFLTATTHSISAKRMDDRECVLRFCAFHLTHYVQYTKPDLETFLAGTMANIRTMSKDPDRIAGLRSAFKSAMKKSYRVFGDNSFRKMYELNVSRRSPINKALFETWSVCLEKHNLVEIEKAAEGIVRGFIAEMNNNDGFVDAISQGTGDVNKVKTRFETVEKIIKEALKCSNA